MNKSKILRKETFTSTDFYNKFVSSGNNKFAVKGYREGVDRVTYNKIIKRFFLIYFNEVFFLDKSLFFVLGGKLMKCRISKFYTKQGTFINETVSFLWYLRPIKRMFYKMSLNIQKGSTNSMPKLRKEYCQTNDVGLLPLKKDLQEQLVERNLMIKQ